MDRENLLNLAIETWGEIAQTQMAIEECAELIKALCKLHRDGSVDDVIEEIADVQIMLDQLKILFGAENVRKIEENKLERLELMINRRIGRSDKCKEYNVPKGLDADMRYVGRGGSGPDKA